MVCINTRQIRFFCSNSLAFRHARQFTIAVLVCVKLGSLTNMYGDRNCSRLLSRCNTIVRWSQLQSPVIVLQHDSTLIATAVACYCAATRSYGDRNCSRLLLRYNTIVRWSQLQSSVIVLQHDQQPISDLRWSQLQSHVIALQYDRTVIATAVACYCAATRSLARSRILLPLYQASRINILDNLKTNDYIYNGAST